MMSTVEQSNKLHEQAVSISDQFPDDVEITSDQIEERLEVLVEEFKVPMDEARRAVTSHFLALYGLEFDDLETDSSTSDSPVELVEVTSAGEWITVVAQVVQLWEPRSDSIDQVGLLGDESGTLKFTKWSKSDLPKLEEGGVYRFENVVTDEYEGRHSVNLNNRTSIEPVDEELEIGDNSSEIEGALVAIQSGSGLIKRCPEEDCTRVLQNGRCADHGVDIVPGEFDLRLKAVFDDGYDVHDVIFDADATAAVTGIDIERAKHMAMDSLDTSVVLDEMEPEVLGRFYWVRGPTVGRYLLAQEIEPPVEIDSEAVLINARSM